MDQSSADGRSEASVAAPERGPARSRRLVLSVSMIAVAWTLLESIALVAHLAANGALFSVRGIEAVARAQLLTGTPERGPRGLDPFRSVVVEVVHPYYGFVPDPHAAKGWAFSDLGFLDYSGDGSLPKRRPGRASVGIFGGSFAVGMYASTHSRLSACLASAAGAPAVVANFAQGGYKQPQQLLTLSYLYSIGAEFDLVINLDGFNEVGLPLYDNLLFGTNPYYPRAWHERVRNLIGHDQLLLLARLESLRHGRHAATEWFVRWHLYWSPTFSLAWSRVDRWFAREIEQSRSSLVPPSLQYRLTSEALSVLAEINWMPPELLPLLEPLRDARFASRSEFLDAARARIGVDRMLRYQDRLVLAATRSAGWASGYVANGPAYPYQGAERLYSDLAQVWKRASVQMQAITTASGARYFHFLQPNQYVRGSKPMTEAEQAVALWPDHHYGLPARQGYRFLREAGKQLLEQGVNFTDLTMVYAGNSAALYQDNCCHVNEQGYAIVADRICEVIRSRVGTPDPS
jgi:hypothetical protein